VIHRGATSRRSMKRSPCWADRWAITETPIPGSRQESVGCAGVSHGSRGAGDPDGGGFVTLRGATRWCEHPGATGTVMASADHHPGRAALAARVAERSEPFDLVVIGGGATGLGVALDAAARGFSVALFEAEDFAKGTSSRATKLVHGGVRYLAQGDIKLVREALRERAVLLANAPHLAGPLPFVLPTYGWRGRLWDRWFYGAGLLAYDLLAGSASLGRTGLPGPGRLADEAPGVQLEGLAGGVSYVDGQFDDARLAVALARTAAARGAIVLNYCRVVGLACDGLGRHEVVVEDRETGQRLSVAARCVINATGVWVDAVRRLDDPAAEPMVSPSQGVEDSPVNGTFATGVRSVSCMWAQAGC
jgi:glycine/D-amino acid oxidase-like deaminating enzyme